MHWIMLSSLSAMLERFPTRPQNFVPVVTEYNHSLKMVTVNIGDEIIYFRWKVSIAMWIEVKCEEVNKKA